MANPGQALLGLKDAFTKPLEKKFDEAIESKLFSPFVAVFLDGTCKIGHTQYVNSGTTGFFLDHICDELIEKVESTFNVGRSAQLRGLMGHSSGGFGALYIAMNRPDVFLNVVSSAPDLWFDQLYLPMIPNALTVIEKHKGIKPFLEAFLNSPNPMRLMSRKETETMLLLNMCACFLPNDQSAPLYGDLFFDLETGERIEQLWQKLKTFDLLTMIDQHHMNLKKMQCLHLSVGQNDEYGLNFGLKQFCKKLSQYNVRHEFEQHSGGHMGQSYRFFHYTKVMLDCIRL